MSSTIVGSLTHQAEMATPQMEKKRWRVPITRLPVLKLQQIGRRHDDQDFWKYKKEVVDLIRISSYHSGTWAFA